MKIQLEREPCSTDVKLFLYNKKGELLEVAKEITFQTFLRGEAIPKESINLRLNSFELKDLYDSLKTEMEKLGLVEKGPSEEVIRELREQIEYLKKWIDDFIEAYSERKK